MQFCRDIFMGQQIGKTKNDLIIVFRNGIHPRHMIYCGISQLIKMCLLLYMWHLNDNCITVCGKWIFDSNLKVALPLTKVCLNYICCGNDTDENKFICVLYEIRAVPTEVFQRKGIHPRHMIY